MLIIFWNTKELEWSLESFVLFMDPFLLVLVVVNTVKLVIRFVIIGSDTIPSQLGFFVSTIVAILQIH